MLHTASVILLSSLFFTAGFGLSYFIFIGLIAVLFVIEHRIVKPDDISNINIAFFNINSVISVLVFAAILTGHLTRG
jgi:4-hydroxybenzoate polyprenyltransferase